METKQNTPGMGQARCVRPSAGRSMLFLLGAGGRATAHKTSTTKGFCNQKATLAARAAKGARSSGGFPAHRNSTAHAATARQRRTSAGCLLPIAKGNWIARRGNSQNQGNRQRPPSVCPLRVLLRGWVTEQLPRRTPKPGLLGVAGNGRQRGPVCWAWRAGAQGAIKTKRAAAAFSACGRP